jgi:hypothetical protein
VPRAQLGVAKGNAMQFITVSTEEGEAIVAVHYIVSVHDLKRDEQHPDRGASIRCQVGDEIYFIYTTMRANEVFDLLVQLVQS